MIIDVDLLDVLYELAEARDQHHCVAVVQVQHSDSIIAPINLPLRRVEEDEVP